MKEYVRTLWMYGTLATPTSSGKEASRIINQNYRNRKSHVWGCLPPIHRAYTEYTIIKKKKDKNNNDSVIFICTSIHHNIYSSPSEP